jgi:hypothetical protein
MIILMVKVIALNLVHECEGFVFSHALLSVRQAIASVIAIRIV